MPRWRMPTAGSSNSLFLEEDDDGSTPLEPGQVKIQMKACGLNFADIFAVLGLYSATPKGSFTPGLEFSGVVIEVGEGVAPTAAGWCPKKGDSVMGVTRFGGYTTCLNVNALYVRPLPEGWSFAQGASFLCTSMTAWYGLVNLGGLRKGHTVLVHSAAGGVGLACLEICDAHGARVIATVGGTGKVGMLQERAGLPAEQIIVRTTGGQFGAQLDSSMEAMGCKEGIDIVMDSLQGPYFNPAYEKLSRGGRMVVFGAASMTPPGSRPNWIRLAWQWLFRPMVDPLEIIAANKGVLGFNLIWMWDRESEMTEMLDTLFSTVKWKQPHVGSEFPFAEAPKAMRHLQSGKSTGKVVLVIE